jgi:hypothetical protein
VARRRGVQARARARARRQARGRTGLLSTMTVAE